MSSKLPIVAIIGRPNVGKSSVFNRLVGKRQAVVAQEAGTTRDPVENMVQWQGKSFWLVDTAGASSAVGELEQSIQSQIEEVKESADLIIMVVDAANLTSQQDKQVAKLALKTGKPVVLVVNKLDTVKNKLPPEAPKLGIKTVIGFSAIHGIGYAELMEQIGKLVPAKPVKQAKDRGVGIAFLGRPNVGKSSLFNALLGNQKALVAEAAGTTRDVNRAQLKYQGKGYQIFDTAGWRKIGKTKAIEHFSILRTVQTINEMDVGILVIDASEPATALDQKVAGMVKDAGKGLIVAVNKWDLVRDEEAAEKHLRQRLQHEFSFVNWAPLVLTSATSGHNVKKLMEVMQTVIAHRNLKLPTKVLNGLLQEVMAAHPPAGLRNRHPKLKYVTQTGTNPPQITLFGSQIEFLHWSYKRHLENELRQAFDLTGTPIDLQFRSKYREKPSP